MNALAARRITLSLPVFPNTELREGTHVVLAPRNADITLYGAFGEIATVGDDDTVTVFSDALTGGPVTYFRDEINIRIPGITPID